MLDIGGRGFADGDGAGRDGDTFLKGKRLVGAPSQRLDEMTCLFLPFDVLPNIGDVDVVG